MFQVNVMKDNGHEIPAYFTTEEAASTFFWHAFHAGLDVTNCNVSDCYAEGPYTYADEFIHDMMCAEHNSEYLYEKSLEAQVVQ
jgi:hypothetical protein